MAVISPAPDSLEEHVEHRLDDRIPVQMKLEVFRNGKCLGKFPVKDISAGGIGFYDKHTRLNHHDFLDVLVPAAFLEQDRPGRVQALVVRNQGDEVGTMLAAPRTQNLDTNAADANAA